MRTLLILNPMANRGGGAKLVPQIIQALHQAEVEYDLKQTEKVGQATEFALFGAIAGYERIVAVGGDGTCNEVVNGLILAQKQGLHPIFGIIPAGSGNDLAHALGIPGQLEEACMILQQGTSRLMDVGRVTVDGKSHFFANGVGLGLDAEVTLQSRQTRFLTGFAMYLWSALRVIFTGKWPYAAQISVEGIQYQETLTLFTVANGVRAGGGFYLTPTAKLDDGLFDICYASRLSAGGALRLLPQTLKGGHTSHPAITMRQAKQVEIFVDKGIPAHIDGEILSVAGQYFVFEILPEILSVWVGDKG